MSKQEVGIFAHRLQYLFGVPRAIHKIKECGTVLDFV
jgi:hypothetical protein